MERDKKTKKNYWKKLKTFPKEHPIIITFLLIGVVLSIFTKSLIPIESFIILLVWWRFIWWFVFKNGGWFHKKRK